MKCKRMRLALLLLALMLCLSACKQNPSEEQLFSKLIAHFEGHGFQCELGRLAETDPERDVPIYNASAWHRLMLDEEEVLVYFDESNRADFLSEPIDESVYGHVGRFGLRFILVYPGDDPAVLAAFSEMPQ